MNRKRNFLFSLIILIGSSVLFPACGGKKGEEKKPEASVQPASELERLNQLIAKDSRNPDYLVQRARIYNSQKQFQNALNDMNAAIGLDSTRAELWMVKADALFGLVQVPLAMEAFKKVISLDPKSIEPYLKLAELSLYIKEYQQTLNYANGALKIDSKKTKAYFIKGFVYKETNDTARAISSFQTCVEQEPQYYEAHMQLGILYAAKKNKLALQYYDNALRLKPNSIEALYDRGMFYQEAEDYNKAMEDYNAILRIDPKNKEACFNLGYIHLAYLKVYRQAILHFTQAIRCDSNYLEAYYNRGISFENLGDIDHAAADYRKALAIYPKYELARKGLERVRN